MSGPAAGQPAARPAFDPYDQEITWAQCPGDTNDCASVEVPVDWNDLTGATISVSFARFPATDPDRRMGSLLVNPGGPGASGITSLGYLVSIMPEVVRERYDIIGFDPRGVGLSSPVECYDDREMDEMVNFMPAGGGTTEGIKESHDVANAFAAACLKNTGEALGHVDSGSAARDMDIIRAALGDEKLNYVGFSYGTYLGALYAEAFPDRVGRLVLDGVVDPTLPSDQESVTQLASFESSLRSYVQDCQGGPGCPLTGSPDNGAEQLQEFLADLQGNPLNTSWGRPLTQAMGVTALIVAMYSESMWPALTQALGMAMGSNRDGSAMLQLADAYYERDSFSGAFQNNMFEAFAAINCLDKPVDARRASIDAFNDAMIDASPTFGPYALNGPVSCAEWPFPATQEPRQITAPGAPPILVIGTTGDPATPYDNSVALAQSLESGVLITREGVGHTAMGASTCIDAAVADFMVNDKTPDADLTCPS